MELSRARSEACQLEKIYHSGFRRIPSRATAGFWDACSLPLLHRATQFYQTKSMVIIMIIIIQVSLIGYHIKFRV